MGKKILTFGAGFAGLLLTYLFLCSPFFDPEPAKETKEVVVIFRDDDIQEGLNEPVLDLFRKYKVPQTYALVPFKYDLLKERPGVVSFLKEGIRDKQTEVALHGYKHEFLDPQKKFSEFRNRPYDEQIRKIRQGKVFLESTFGESIRLFIPPKNSYDKNTLRALEEAGIPHLSSTIFFHPEAAPRILIANATHNLENDIVGDLKYALRHGPSPGMFIIYYHSSYITGSGVGYYVPRVDELLRFIRSDERIRPMLFSEAAGKYGKSIRAVYASDQWRARAEVLSRFFHLDPLSVKLHRLAISSEAMKVKLFSILFLCWFFALVTYLCRAAYNLLHHVFCGRIDRWLRVFFAAALLLSVIFASITYTTRGFVGILFGIGIFAQSMLLLSFLRVKDG